MGKNSNPATPDTECWETLHRAHSFSSAKLREMFHNYKIGTVYENHFGMKLPYDCDSIKVLMLGETHAGKSSTINHIYSALKGKAYIGTIAEVGGEIFDGTRTPTTPYPKKHLLFMENNDKKQRVELWDYRGFVNKESALESLPIILGKQDPSFQVPRKKDEQAIQKYTSHSQQTKKGRFHLVLAVVPKTASLEAISYYKQIKTELEQERIPILWILTKTDCDARQDPMYLIGVSKSGYLPLKNYVDAYTGDLEEEQTRQALTILLFIINYAEQRGFDVKELSKLQLIKWRLAECSDGEFFFGLFVSLLFLVICAYPYM